MTGNDIGDGRTNSMKAYLRFWAEPQSCGWQKLREI
jgi:hypothetical protein